MREVFSILADPGVSNGRLLISDVKSHTSVIRRTETGSETYKTFISWLRLE